MLEDPMEIIDFDKPKEFTLLDS